MIYISTDLLKGLSVSEIQKRIQEHYKQNIQGLTILNENLNIVVRFTKLGRNKTIFGSTVYPKKAALIFYLPEIVKNAQYNNWGNRKTTDQDYVIGYLNFNCKVSIDGKPEKIHLVIQMRKDGKFYYTLEVNRIKKSRGNV